MKKEFLDLGRQPIANKFLMVSFTDALLYLSYDSVIVTPKM